MLLVWYPKCTTCQRAKAWLDAHGVAVETRDIKLEKPTEEELRRWYAMSGLPLKRFFNTSGLQYKALGLKDKLPGMSEEKQFALLATDGMLVKRPILVGENFAVTGFKEAEWMERLEQYREARQCWRPWENGLWEPLGPQWEFWWYADCCWALWREKVQSSSIVCSDGAGSSLPAWPGLRFMSWDTTSCVSCLGSR